VCFCAFVCVEFVRLYVDVFIRVSAFMYFFVYVEVCYRFLRQSVYGCVYVYVYNACMCVKVYDVNRNLCHL
jgi:hypothetical protein